jgi:hypothetical protein
MGALDGLRMLAEDERANEDTNPVQPKRYSISTYFYHRSWGSSDIILFPHCP